jgi:hypothetical protein
VCASWPWKSLAVPDAYDTRQAIKDLSYRVTALENELAQVKAQKP